MPPFERTNARVGDLEFPQRYSDPVVDVDMETNTVEQETINDSIIVQNFGKRADRISIEGVIVEDDIGTFDELVEQDTVQVTTHRWSGEAIVTSTTSNYTHSYDIFPSDDVASEWLYDITIDLIEVQEVPSTAQNVGVNFPEQEV